MKNLVIVESPAKAKTIEKFLGKDFKVMSSYGHIRDLRKKDFSIDVDNDFSPVYEIPDEKKQLVKELKASAAKADTVWLASDEDREGEAIAWHLYEVLGLKPDSTKRIVFHEITKPAILHAIENPRGIDINRVNAQQARRVLDRIVGFELSPVLWKKIKPALSAGRVQSVAVRLICEREKEIRDFKPDEYFRITARLTPEGSDTPVKAELNKRLSDEHSAISFLQDCEKADFNVKSIAVKPVKRSPAPPFTTSTLQQEASRRLGFSVNQTMMVAQKLYEAGLITYMRTDSLNLSSLALKDISVEIQNTIGADYLKVRKYHTSSKGAQEAHEAIRPTYISNRSIDGTPQEKRLYDLIWKRTIASQMADAMLEKTNVEIAISTRDEFFEAVGEMIVFDGFMKIYRSAEHDTDSEMLPPLTEKTPMNAEEITATQRFTLAPVRYNEASLVKKMEDLGIGRPSTYAPTISTIQAREYVRKGEDEGAEREFDTFTLRGGKIEDYKKTEKTGSEKGRLVPTDIGMVVNDFLTDYFPDILDYNFTAKVEEKFDEIAEGELGWKKELEDFYSSFHPNIKRVSNLRLEHKVGERFLGYDDKNRPVSVKIGRFGPLVQIGDTSGDEKPLFASLQKGQSVSTLTLEDALKLFSLPRIVGAYNGKDMTVAVGRFGPYVKYDGLFASIPKNLDPMSLTLEQAIELVEKKLEADKNRLIKKFDEAPEIEILNGRFGPYIAYKKDGAKKASNYKIPKSQNPAELTLDEIRGIIEAQDAAPVKKTRKTARKK